MSTLFSFVAIISLSFGLESEQMQEPLHSQNRENIIHISNGIKEDGSPMGGWNIVLETRKVTPKIWKQFLEKINTARYWNIAISNAESLTLQQISELDKKIIDSYRAIDGMRPDIYSPDFREETTTLDFSFNHSSQENIKILEKISQMKSLEKQVYVVYLSINTQIQFENIKPIFKIFASTKVDISLSTISKNEIIIDSNMIAFFENLDEHKINWQHTSKQNTTSSAGLKFSDTVKKEDREKFCKKWNNSLYILGCAE